MAARDPAAGLAFALDPRSIAIIGASANPDKIGGRPIAHMRRSGYRGTIFPINPSRAEVQGIAAFSSLAELPHAPDLAIIAVPAGQVEAAVSECADRGVGGAVIMSSGFGETGTSSGQDRLAAIARASGMRLIGPNSQGIANFANGAIASFSTMFSEVEPQDGPVAIIAQSGAMSVLPYAALRGRGIGVRYSLATGNECDLTVSDFALAVLADPAIRLLLLYFEGITDPHTLAAAAKLARGRGVPIVALKAGRSEHGQRMANSHTGALATEDRVVDAFLKHHGIWRTRDIRSMVGAAELYLAGWRPAGNRLLAISNSGASCVMAADEAARLGMKLATLKPATIARLRAALPDFAGLDNPIDLTAMLLTNSRLLTDILPALSGDDAGDVTFFGLPLAGAGYDLDAISDGAAQFAKATRRPFAVATPLPRVAALFAGKGVPTFTFEADAIAALDQLCRHSALIRRQPARPLIVPALDLPAAAGTLSEWQSLTMLRSIGLPVVPSKLCRTLQEARSAFRDLGGSVAVKGCSAGVPHKSDHGLVRLGLGDEEAVAAAFAEIERRLSDMGCASEGVIVAAMASGRHELALGARMDPRFGPVVLVGDGGRYVELLKDYELLLHPAGEGAIRAAFAGLRIAPLLAGARGDPPCNLDAAVHIVRALGSAAAAAQGRILSIDLNPVIVGARAEETLILDALIELGTE
jgi:acyl-CoA synthetase (NDP forming)